MDHLEHYREHGYAVVKGVFDRREVGELSLAFDRLYARALGYGASFRHQNVLFRLGDDPNVGRIVRMVQWPSYVDPVLARYRNDPRMLAILAPLLGDDLKQIINQMHWKPPGAQAVEWGYHQDIRSRRPREAYRSPAASYIQTGIAIDPHGEENGAMTVVPGSHRLGSCRRRAARSWTARSAIATSSTSVSIRAMSSTCASIPATSRSGTCTPSTARARTARRSTGASI